MRIVIKWDITQSYRRKHFGFCEFFNNDEVHLKKRPRDVAKYRITFWRVPQGKVRQKSFHLNFNDNAEYIGMDSVKGIKKKDLKKMEHEFLLELFEKEIVDVKRG